MNCPPRDIWERLLAEQLPDAEIAHLSRHLEWCAHCRTELDSLSTPFDYRFASDRGMSAPPIGEPSAAFLRRLGRLSGMATPNPFGSDEALPRFGGGPPGYELLEILGRGGAGLVYKARQISLNRLVALKMLLSGQGATSFEVTRFREEAQVIAGLQHPHIVQIYEIGETEGQPFIALELIEGGSLSQLLAEGPFPPRAAAALLEKIARAIHYAHQQGVIHRDLKPQNILIHRWPVPQDDQALVRGPHLADGPNRNSDDLWPKVSDFGLAKRLDAVGLTQTGEIVGTPSYMAPEQARGERPVHSPAVDVYGLGAILYHLMTGRPPFQGVNSIDTLMQVMHNDPVAPRHLQPNVPWDLQTICLKCLEKQPHRRYATAEELAEDLQRFRQGQPIRARRSGWPTRLARWGRRHPAATTFLFAFGIAFLVITWSLWQTEAARHSEALARQQEQAQRELAELRLAYSRIALADGAWQANHVSRAEQYLDLCQPLKGRTDRRDWEWYYLKRLCQAHLHSRIIHRWPVFGLSFSPDGRLLATAAGSPGFSEDARITPGEVRVWDAKTLELIAELPGHQGRACAAVFRPDGQQLASIALDGIVRLWDTASWQIRLQIPASVFGDFGGVGINYSRDGRLLAVVHERSLRLLDTQQGSLIAELGPFPQHARNVVFHPGGDRVAVGWGSFVEVFHLSERRSLFRVPAEPLAVSFSPDGQLLGVARQHAVVLHDASDGRERKVLLGHEGDVRTIAWSRDGRDLASGSADQTVRLWDPRTGVEKRRFRGHSATVMRLALHPNTGQVVSADMFGALKVWDTQRDQRGHIITVRPEISDIAFSADGQNVSVAYASGGGGAVASFHAQSGRADAELEIPWARRLEWPIKYLALSPDARLLVAPDRDDSTVLHVWDLVNRKIQWSLRGHRLRVRTVAFSRDGLHLASAAGDPGMSGSGELFVWPLLSRAEHSIVPIRLPTTEIYQCLAFSPDSQKLAAGEVVHGLPKKDPPEPASVSIWDLPSAKLDRRWHAHPTAVQCVVWHPNGRILATGARAPDRGLGLWDVASGTCRHRLEGPFVLTCLNFNPSGSRLAAVGYDGIVLLIDPYIGQEVLAVRGLTPQRPAERACDGQVVFSPDGHKLAVNIWDGSVCIYDATPMRHNDKEVPSPAIGRQKPDDSVPDD